MLPDACGVHEVGHDPVGHDITGVEVMFVLLEVQAGNVNGVVARGRMGRFIPWRGSARRALAGFGIMAVLCHGVGCCGR